MLIPETETPETLGHVSHADRPDANILDAASRGTREGLQLALNIAAMLIAFIGLIALIDAGLGPRRRGWLGSARGRPRAAEVLSLKWVFGWILAPVAWLLGIPWKDCAARRRPARGADGLERDDRLRRPRQDQEDPRPRSFSITTFALCGFANFSSIGIQLGGIGALAPERRGDLARLGFRAMLAGTLANFLSACIAGILL